MTRSLPALGLAVCLIGCEPVQPAAESLEVPNPIVGMGMIRFSPGPAITDTSREARLERLRSAQHRVEVVHGSTDGLSLSDWSEADARLAAAVSQFEGREREQAQQTASAAMLRVWLPAANDTPEVRRAYARHALILAREGSPETEVIADAIERAGEEMPEAGRIEAARLGAEAARDRLARIAACKGPGCDGPPSDIFPDHAISERDAQALRRLDAILAADS